MILWLSLALKSKISLNIFADGVAVVLYNMMNSFAQLEAAGEVIGVDQIMLGLVSFFTVALGGLSIGCIGGLITALITKTTKDVRGEKYSNMFGLTVKLNML